MERQGRIYRGSTVGRYLSDIRSYPLLNRSEERTLSRRLSYGVREARDEMVLGNLGFVVKIAGEYRNMGMTFEDLLNEGNIGLIQAASKFDHRKGVRFITYAVWWIRKSILKALGEQVAMIRVTRYHRKKLARLQSPAPSCHPVSLEDALDGGQRRLIDVLTDHRAENPEREVLRKERIARVMRGLSCLSARERFVIAGRFGLAGRQVSTLKEIGDTIGLTRERVRQIEMDARHKLRMRLGH